MEISQVADAISFRIDVEGVAGTHLAYAAVKAEAGREGAASEVDRIVQCVTIGGVAASDVVGEGGEVCGGRVIGDCQETHRLCGCRVRLFRSICIGYAHSCAKCTARDIDRITRSRATCRIAAGDIGIAA